MGGEAAGPLKAGRTREGASALQPFQSLQPGPPLTAQELHAQGDAVVPGHGQDAHKAGQERRLKHVLLVRVIIEVAREDLAFHSPLVPVFSPVLTIITVGHPVGCHILDMAKVSGPLGDDAGHSPQGA